jgi:hypothetical protein
VTQKEQKVLNWDGFLTGIAHVTLASDGLMLLSQRSLARRLFLLCFSADSAHSQQLDSNLLESIEIESIAQIPTEGLREWVFRGCAWFSL